jgi:D-3-phosphoglycerate dehydrogenase
MKPVKILVTEKIDEAGLELLRREAQVDVCLGLTPAQLLEVISEYDALLVRSATKVTAEVLAAGTRLKVVGRAGVGYDNIDVDAATQRGIVVVNARGASSIAVAEHTMALMLALARHIPQAYTSLRRGEWRRGDFVGVELRDKTLGLIGLGRIGAEVAKRAIAFEMRVLAYDPFVSTEHARRLGVTLVSLDELLAQADFVSLHTPLTKDTRRLINAAALARMKPGARLINTARGELVDSQALLEALERGHLAGAALDVFDVEPPPLGPLILHDRVIAVPHLGASTEEAQVAVAIEVAGHVLAALRGEPTPGAVNLPYVLPEAMQTLRPYMRLAEALGRFQSQLRHERLESIELVYHGEIAEHDTTPLTAAALMGLLDEISEERVNLVNATVVARRFGLRVEERRSSSPQGNFTNLVEMTVRADSQSYTVAGTVWQGEPRIVRIDEYWVNFEPSGNLLITRHRDRPGLIGRVGTILGNADVNISEMQVGRRVRRGEALMILRVDEEIPPEAEREIRAIPDIWSVQQVKLP